MRKQRLSGEVTCPRPSSQEEVRVRSLTSDPAHGLAWPGPCPPGGHGLAVTQASLAYLDKDLWLLSRPPSPPGSNEGHSAFPVAFTCLVAISGPTCHLCWEELGTTGCVSLPRGVSVPSSSRAAGDLCGLTQALRRCVFSCVLAVPLCPCPGECAQLASLGTRLSCSSLIYYKGGGDKRPREPPRIQCPHRSSQWRPQCGHVTGSERWNFCRVCFAGVADGVFFSSCPVCWRGHSVRMRPRSCCGECEPAVLAGACYRLRLRARHQAGHLWPGPGPLRTCVLRHRPDNLV